MANHMFKIMVAGNEVARYRADDAASAKAIYCHAHAEVAKECVKAVRCYNA